MSALNDTNKYIQRLVRIVTEKEKLIDQLKRQGKEKERENRCQEMLNSSMVEQQLRDQLHEMTQEVRSLVAKMNAMDEKVQILKAGLKEETQINQQLLEQVRMSQKRELSLHQTILLLTEDLQTTKQHQSQSLQVEQQKIKILLRQVQQLRQQLKLNERQSKQKRELVQIMSIRQKEFLQSRQNIENIYFLINSHQRIDQDGTTTNGKREKIQNAIQQLKTIASFVQTTMTSQHQCFLNQSLEGISIIMPELEEKLQKAHCMTDRHNLYQKCLELEDLELKQTTRSVPPFLVNHDLPAETLQKQSGYKL